MKKTFLADFMGWLGFPEATPAATDTSKEASFAGIDAHGIEDLFEHIFAQLEVGDRTKPHYAWNRHTYAEVADLCITLLGDYPATRMVGIGNSASYITHGIAQLAEFRQQELETIYVPFSGGHLKPYSRNKPCHGIFKLDKKSLYYKATLKYAPAYRKLLTTQGLHPKKIFRDFSERNLRTGFIDNVQSGVSFASFLHIMFDWAKECGLPASKFASAVHCIALSADAFPPEISLPHEKLSFTVDVIIISEPLRLAINSNLSAESDRFLPHYPSLMWHKPPVNLGERSASAVTAIQAAIAKAVRGVSLSKADLELPPHPGSIYRDQYFSQVRMSYQTFLQPAPAAKPVITAAKEKSKTQQILIKPTDKSQPIAVALTSSAPADDVINSLPLTIDDQTSVMLSPSKETPPPVKRCATEAADEPAAMGQRSWTFAEASDAALKLVKAFNALESELSHRHLQLFTRAEGIGLNWRPAGLEQTIRQSRLPTELAIFKLLQVRNYLGDAVALDDVVEPAAETLVAALRVYQNSPVLDRSITDCWLNNDGDDSAAAQESHSTPASIKAARARVIGRVTQALLHDHPAI